MSFLVSGRIVYPWHMSAHFAAKRFQNFSVYEITKKLAAVVGVISVHMRPVRTKQRRNLIWKDTRAVASTTPRAKMC